MNPGKKRVIKLIALIICLCIDVGIVSFFFIQRHIVQSTTEYILHDAADAPLSDAVMVLGAFVTKSGNPSLILRDRLDYGHELYIQGKAKKILISGDHGQVDYDEVNTMRNYLLEKGVPSEDIFMDHAGFNTYDSMYRAKAIFGVETLLISTQEFHINRAVFIARKLEIQAYGYPCADKPTYNMIVLNIRESLARAKAYWDTLVMRNPRFLGEPIPISGNGNETIG